MWTIGGKSYPGEEYQWDHSSIMSLKKENLSNRDICTRHSAWWNWHSKTLTELNWTEGNLPEIERSIKKWTRSLQNADPFPTVQSIQFVVQSLSGVWLFATPGTVAHQAPLSSTTFRFAQIHVHWVGDAIQPSHPLSSPSPPPALNPSQHQDLFKLVSSSHQVAKVLEFQLQHESFQWTPRTDVL